MFTANVILLITAYKKKSPLLSQRGSSFGAANQIRTDDLILTKDVLYQLSYSSFTT